MPVNDVNQNNKSNQNPTPGTCKDTSSVSMKTLIFAVFITLVLALLIPHMFTNETSEDVVLLFNNVTIRIQTTRRMLIGWLVSYLNDEENVSNEGAVNNIPNNNGGGKTIQIKEDGRRVSLPAEIVKLMQHAFKDSTKTTDIAASNVAKDIKSLKFEEFDERNLCDVNKGILLDDFNITVQEIGEFLNLPDDLVKIIVRSAKFNDQKQASVESKTFKGKDGFLYFGKFVIARTRGGTVAFAYSLHGIKFKLAPRKKQPSDLKESFISFSESAMEKGLETETKTQVSDQVEEKAYISKEAVEGFINHYLHETYKHFINNCKGQLDMLEDVQREDRTPEYEQNEK